jgi:predicted kinase
MGAMALPTLVVVSGPAGTGKTTLAHELARAVGCPAVCRDEIKEGMVHATDDFVPRPGDALTMRTLPLFFAVVRLLLEGGVTVVAEAAFQDEVWRPHLEPLAALARLRVVQCHTDTVTARERMAGRRERTAHTDASVIADLGYHVDFRRLALPAPSLDVDTTSGYDPPLDRIVGFVNQD